MMPTGGGEAVTATRSEGEGRWRRICPCSVPPRGTRFFFFALFFFFARPFGLCEDGARRRLYVMTHPTQVAARDSLRDYVVMMYFCWLFLLAVRVCRRGNLCCRYGFVCCWCGEVAAYVQM